ncbi:MAG: alpha/beta fold hydrolase BchO [Pseudomonadota bacterium]
MPLNKVPPLARRGDPDWYTDAKSWPNGSHSEFWRVGQFVWHIQRRGDGPVMLLIHGTGAATHSWAPLVEILHRQFTTISVDLPGHGFTRSPRNFRPTLTNISTALTALLSDMDICPTSVVGHSAGAAIAVSMVARRELAPSSLVSINGALKPFEGPMQIIAPTIAKAATFGGLAARMVSRNSSGPSQIRNLISSIGSDPDKVDVTSYASLLQRHGHIQGALSMMANWDLTSVLYDCTQIEQPILFIAGGNDLAVAPDISKHAAGRAPNGAYFEIDGVGHLAHEENPEAVADIIVCELARLTTSN